METTISTSNKIKKSETLSKTTLVGKDEKLNSVFAKFDTNKDGLLDSTEIDVALKTLAKGRFDKRKSGLPEGEIDDSFERRDELKESGWNIKSLRKFSNKFYKEFDKNVFLNGEISASSQSDESGDCWLLTGINSLSYTDEGKKMLKDCISEDEQGNVTVDLKGANRKYTFPSSELLPSKDRKAVRGDYDIKAIEKAFKMYRTDVMAENKNNPNKNKSILTYSGLGTKNDPLYGGLLEEAVFVLTGKRSMVYSDKSYNSKVNNATETPQGATSKDLSLKEIKPLLDQIEKNPNKYATACCFKEGSSLIGEHGYSLKSVDGNIVTLVNPWCSSAEVKISKELFMENLIGFATTNLSENSEEKQDKFSLKK